MSYQLWKLADGRPALHGARDDKPALEKLRRMELSDQATAIGWNGLVLGSMHCTPKQIDAFRAAVKAAHLATGGALPPPLPEPTKAPAGRSNGMVFGRGKPLAASSDDDDDDDEAGEGDEVVAVAHAPKTTRPAATRPPLARRRVTSVAGGTLTSTAVAPAALVADADPPPRLACGKPSLAASARCEPALRPLCASHRALAHRHMRTSRITAAAAVARVVDRVEPQTRQRAATGRAPAALAPAAPPVDAAAPAPVEKVVGDVEPPAPAPCACRVELEQMRDDVNVAGVLALREAEAAASKIAGLQRLLGAVSTERDALRDRLEGAERTATDAARVARDAMEQGLIACDWTRLRAELAEEERDAAVAQLAAATATANEALVAGLAAVDEARAETDAMSRHAAELSRQLGTLRDAAASAVPVPAQVLLDEVMLARVAEQAARRAVRVSREDATLRALASSVGGVQALAGIVEFVAAAGGIPALEKYIASVEQLLRSVG